MPVLKAFIKVFIGNFLHMAQCHHFCFLHGFIEKKRKVGKAGISGEGADLEHEMGDSRASLSTHY